MGLSFDFWPQAVQTPWRGGPEVISAYHEGCCGMLSVTDRGRKEETTTSGTPEVKQVS